jgi:hypothetical protein
VVNTGEAHPAPGEAELIPRRVLFGNPERRMPRLSPDGARLAWIAPHHEVLNVWVAPMTVAGGVGQQPLLSGAEVQRPQAARRVVAALAAQKEHGRPVRREREMVRRAEGEAPGPGELGRQRERRRARHPATYRLPARRCAPG